MNDIGGIIARALAIVAIATGAAFVHRGYRPLTLELKDPRGAAPEPAAGVLTPADPQTPGVEGATEDVAAEPGAGPSPESTDFDPDALGSEIGTADAHRLWLLGSVAFIDARPQKDYVEGHIPFAYLVPAESIDAGRLGEMMELGGLDSTSRVVVYCDGGTCDASHLVALTLQDMGFEKIHIDVDGFPAWVASGLEVETGPDQVLGDFP